MKNRGLLLVVSGPSGAGKGTICKALVEKCPELFLSVSATTRKPRPGEMEGINYFFKSEQQFKDMIQNNQLLEYAFFCENCYGTPRDHVEAMLDAGRDVILEIEVQGAMKVRSNFPEGVYIFILPPSLEELRNRILGRGTETPSVIEERLKTATIEMHSINKYNYIITNDYVENAVSRLEAIILAEKCRTERNYHYLKEEYDI